jgi:hypothetical protein
MAKHGKGKGHQSGKDQLPAKVVQDAQKIRQQIEAAERAEKEAQERIRNSG